MELLDEISRDKRKASILPGTNVFFFLIVTRAQLLMPWM